MQNILFWAGYYSNQWDGNTTTGLGGTEIAIINIAEGLRTYGHNVTVAGQVNNSVVNGVEWIDIDNFQAKYSNLPNHFNVIIGVNYIHFLKYTSKARQNSARNIFWMHNTDYYTWYNGEELDSHIQMFSKELDLVIAPSAWACNKIIEDINIPNNIQVMVDAVPNGINIENFTFNIAKDPNKFIWSSAVDRGLAQLLDNWPKIKSVMPSATLDVYYPEYSNPHTDWYNIEGILDKFKATQSLGVTDMGSVSQQELHAAMQKASYWMYLTHYEETFCITALEMQASGVLAICSDVAALENTVRDGIIIPKSDYETMFNDAIKVLYALNVELKDKSIESAKNNAKMHTWRTATETWQHILN